MKKTKYPTPNFESIIYDERDRNAADPSSSVGWFATADDAVNATVEYVSDTAGIYRWEVRDRMGKLIEGWDK
jgi:hypothetical protein